MSKPAGAHSHGSREEKDHACCGGTHAKEGREAAHDTPQPQSVIGEKPGVKVRQSGQSGCCGGGKER
jgi:hypothetical protein